MKISIKIITLLFVFLCVFTVSVSAITAEEIGQMTKEEYDLMPNSTLDEYLTILSRSEQGTRVYGRKMDEIKEAKKIMTTIMHSDINKLDINTMKHYIDVIDKKIKDYKGTQYENLKNKKENMQKRIAELQHTSTLDPENYEPSKLTGSDKVEKIAGKILSIVRNIGVGIAVIALTVIGFKYMIGSVEEKAKYKETLIPLVIGIILIAAGGTIVTAIVKFAISLY